jgi:hypothetical protein
MSVPNIISFQLVVGMNPVSVTIKMQFVVATATAVYNSRGKSGNGNPPYSSVAMVASSRGNNIPLQILIECQNLVHKTKTRLNMAPFPDHPKMSMALRCTPATYE